MPLRDSVPLGFLKTAVLDWAHEKSMCAIHGY